MRNAFAKQLVDLAKEDNKIVLLSGDIGNRLFDPFKAQFPKRFFNCGVAEQNMASMAAGMAMCGFRPITYTITPFNTTRCLEQIRVDICYHNLPVIIVGVGAGLSYASLGPTHHSCEDISFLRSIPNIKVVCPADSYELQALLPLALKENGPVYFRMGKKNEPLVYSSIPQLQIGKGQVIKEGKDISLIGTGNILPLVKEVADRLNGLGIEAQVISMHTVKPIDTELLENSFNTFSLVCSIEEHSLIGGLGSSIAEWMIDQDIKGSLIRLGVNDQFFHKIGSQSYLREQVGLTPDKIIEVIIQRLNKENKNENTCSSLSQTE